MNMSKSTEAKIQKAVCVLYPTQGNTVTGVITFTKPDGGIKVVADIQALAKVNMVFIFMSVATVVLLMVLLLLGTSILKGKATVHQQI